MDLAQIIPGIKDHGLKPHDYEVNGFDHEMTLNIPDNRDHSLHLHRDPIEDFSLKITRHKVIQKQRVQAATTVDARQWTLDAADCGLHEKPNGKVGHAWRWVRKALKGTTIPTCDAPVEYLCSWCGSGFLGNCNSHDAEECEKCEMRYRKQVRLLVRQPVLFARPGSVLFMTLTAPGKARHCVKHKYHDKKRDKLVPNYRCDFTDPECVPCPCGENAVRGQEQIGRFNSSISRMFNDFITNVRRKFVEFEDIQYVRAIEPQKRGALHIHFIVRMKRAARITPALQKELTTLVMRLGFGHEFDVQQPAEGDRDVLIKFARYIAKYVSKTLSTAGVPYEDTLTREDLDDFNSQKDFRAAQLDRFHQTGEIPEKGFHWPRMCRVKRPRTWSASRRWGLSMVKIKAQQLAYGLGDKARSASLMEDYMDIVREHQDNLGYQPPTYTPTP